MRHRSGDSDRPPVRVGYPRASLEVPAALDAPEVVARPVRSGHELSLPKRLVDDDLAGKADGPERAGLGAERRDDLVDLCGSDVATQHRGELRLVQPVVAADEREHDLAVRDDRHRLRRCRQVDAEEVGEGLACLDTGRLDLGRRSSRSGNDGARGTPCAISRSAA